MGNSSSNSLLNRRNFIGASGVVVAGVTGGILLKGKSPQAVPPCSPGFGREKPKLPFSATIGNDTIEIYTLPHDIRVERDVMISMSDGIRIAANIYRPAGEAKVPVICAFTVYDKDLHPYNYAVCGRAAVFRSVGLDFGSMRVSDATPFEAPDPAYWVPKGYAVIHVDGRGSGKSEGKKDPLGERTITDYCEVIEWASQQTWSSGRVGTLGVSYLAVAQWFIAARQPEKLAAIIPWEGFNDLYRDLIFHGGIPETAFIGWWMKADQSATAQGSKAPPLFESNDPFYAGLPMPDIVRTGLALNNQFAPAIDSMALPDVDLTKISVPTMICGSWASQGIHARGAFTAWEKIQSQHKELFTHGRHEWTVAYSPEALQAQERFLERHLKDSSAPKVNLRPVRIEILRDRENYDEFYEATWPLPQTNFTPIYFNSSGQLSLQPPPVAASVSWQSDADESLQFIHEFEADTILCGPMAANLSFRLEEGADADIFIGLHKQTSSGDDVPVYNFLKRDELMARGWLRASHRALDRSQSKPWRPVLSHLAPSKLKPGELYELAIEILPAGMKFEAGSRLVATIKGRDIVNNPNCQHKVLRNKGRHTIICGGENASHLLLPLLA